MKFAAICIFLISCARAPLKNSRDALRLSDAPELSDDLPRESLIEVIALHVKFFEQLRSNPKFKFGEMEYTKDEYLTGLKKFLQLAQQLTSDKDFYEALLAHFDFYEVYGQNSWGEIKLTSYYEPVIPGRVRKEGVFTQALYKTPPDLIKVSTQNFNNIENKSFRAKISQIDRKLTITPYFSREEIDSKKALEGKNLEWLYVDPIDSFFMQIQGTGSVELSNGYRIRLGYDDQNGYPYNAIGSFLREKIPEGQMSMQAIEKVLKEMNEDERQAVLNKNPSYIFFRKMKGRPQTTLGSEVVDGRTIATDGEFFPKGAIAFLSSEKPIVENNQVVGWKDFSRFVMDQDTGGAIKGGGRVDLYWGSGPDAKIHAGAFKQSGTLFYLAPKKTSLDLLN